MIRNKDVFEDSTSLSLQVDDLIKKNPRSMFSEKEKDIVDEEIRRRNLRWNVDQNIDAEYIPPSRKAILKSRENSSNNNSRGLSSSPLKGGNSPLKGSPSRSPSRNRNIQIDQGEPIGSIKYSLLAEPMKLPINDENDNDIDNKKFESEYNLRKLLETSHMRRDIKPQSRINYQEINERNKKFNNDKLLMTKEELENQFSSILFNKDYKNNEEINEENNKKNEYNELDDNEENDITMEKMLTIFQRLSINNSNILCEECLKASASVYCESCSEIYCMSCASLCHPRISVNDHIHPHEKNKLIKQINIEDKNFYTFYYRNYYKKNKKISIYNDDINKEKNFYLPDVEFTTEDYSKITNLSQPNTLSIGQDIKKIENTNSSNNEIIKKNFRKYAKFQVFDMVFFNDPVNNIESYGQIISQYDECHGVSGAPILRGEDSHYYYIVLLMGQIRDVNVLQELYDSTYINIKNKKEHLKIASNVYDIIQDSDNNNSNNSSVKLIESGNNLKLLENEKIINNHNHNQNNEVGMPYEFNEIHKLAREINKKVKELKNLITLGPKYHLRRVNLPRHQYIYNQPSEPNSQLGENISVFSQNYYENDNVSIYSQDELNSPYGGPSHPYEASYRNNYRASQPYGDLNPHVNDSLSLHSSQTLSQNQLFSSKSSLYTSNSQPIQMLDIFPDNKSAAVIAKSYEERQRRVKREIYEIVDSNLYSNINVDAPPTVDQIRLQQMDFNPKEKLEKDFPLPASYRTFEDVLFSSTGEYIPLNITITNPASSTTRIAYPTPHWNVLIFSEEEIHNLKEKVDYFHKKTSHFLDNALEQVDIIMAKMILKRKLAVWKKNVIELRRKHIHLAARKIQTYIRMWLCRNVLDELRKWWADVYEQKRLKVHERFNYIDPYESKVAYSIDNKNFFATQIEVKEYANFLRSMIMRIAFFLAKKRLIHLKSSFKKWNKFASNIHLEEAQNFVQIETENNFFQFDGLKEILKARMEIMEKHLETFKIVEDATLSGVSVDIIQIKRRKQREEREKVNEKKKFLTNNENNVNNEIKFGLTEIKEENEVEINLENENNDNQIQDLEKKEVENNKILLTGNEKIFDEFYHDNLSSLPLRPIPPPSLRDVTESNNIRKKLLEEDSSISKMSDFVPSYFPAYETKLPLLPPLVGKKTFKDRLYISVSSNSSVNSSFNHSLNQSYTGINPNISNRSSIFSEAKDKSPYEGPTHESYWMIPKVLCVGNIPVGYGDVEHDFVSEDKESELERRKQLKIKNAKENFEREYKELENERLRLLKEKNDRLNIDQYIKHLKQKRKKIVKNEETGEEIEIEVDIDEEDIEEKKNDDETSSLSIITDEASLDNLNNNMFEFDELFGLNQQVEEVEEVEMVAKKKTTKNITKLNSIGSLLLSGINTFISILSPQEEHELLLRFEPDYKGDKLLSLNDKIQEELGGIRKTVNNLIMENQEIIEKQQQLIDKIPNFGKTDPRFKHANRELSRRKARVQLCQSNIEYMQQQVKLLPPKAHFFTLPLCNIPTPWNEQHILASIWMIEKLLLQTREEKWGSGVRIHHHHRIYIYGGGYPRPQDGPSKDGMSGMLATILLGRLYQLHPFEAICRWQDAHDTMKIFLNTTKYPYRIPCPPLPWQKSLIINMINNFHKPTQAPNLRAQHNPEVYTNNIKEVYDERLTNGQNSVVKQEVTHFQPQYHHELHETQHTLDELLILHGAVNSMEESSLITGSVLSRQPSSRLSFLKRNKSHSLMRSGSQIINSSFNSLSSFGSISSADNSDDQTNDNLYKNYSQYFPGRVMDEITIPGKDHKLQTLYFEDTSPAGSSAH